jgi:energy-coupling factor transport system substrate-specific component
MKSKNLPIKEICLFGILSALMFVSKIVMEALPNIHLLGMLTVTYTIVFRKKALIPIYVYVFLNGLFAGFNAWWVPYLYIWTVLWGVTMLLPKNMPKAVASVVYPIVCALHGLFFGVLYAPVQALMFGFTFEQTLAWIAAGFIFDIIHTFGNFAVGLLIYPASEALKRLTKDI